jgi:putative peptide zinc metalloprotease protein
VATPIWWGTPAGTWVHEAAYKLVLITGLGVIFFNWNPLIKLDGYYLITEILGIPELKEESTAYVSGWVKRKIWRLPVEIPFVPRRRRLWYVVYALLSGLYSYSLLWFVAKLAGNIASNWWPDWGFLATIGIAFLIFRSRIKTLVSFMKTLYLDKKDRIQAWFATPQRRLAAAVALALLAFLPLFRENIEGRFVLEPVERAVVRAAVPGTVMEVTVIEGQEVAAGQPLLRLRNLTLESDAARTTADLRLATARATDAQLRYADLGATRFQREQLLRQAAELNDRVARLDVTAPIRGVVLTPRVQDRLGQQIEAGDQLVEIGDLSTMRARVYLPEFAVRKARAGTTASLLLDSSFGTVQGEVSAIAPVSHDIAEGLMPKALYKGIAAPIFYVATVEVPNDGTLKAGATGSAKVFVQRRSLAVMLTEPVWDFIWRKVW